MVNPTEKKFNNILCKIWNGGFGLPKKVINRNYILEILTKMDGYKYKKSKRKYQMKIFGTCDGDFISLKSIILLIDRVADIKKGAK